MRQTKSLLSLSVYLLRETFAGCRQSLLGDGPSRRYLCNPCMGAWTSYAAAPLWCSYPFLPKGHRPHPSSDGFGALNSHRNATSTAIALSGLQSFLDVLAPILASTPDCTHRCGSMSAERPGRLRHAVPMRLPNIGCGVVTCLNRAIGTAGLSPAGLQPCRLLPESYDSIESLF